MSSVIRTHSKWIQHRCRSYTILCRVGVTSLLFIIDPSSFIMIVIIFTVLSSSTHAKFWLNCTCELRFFDRREHSVGDREPHFSVHYRQIELGENASACLIDVWGVELRRGPT